MTPGALCYVHLPFCDRICPYCDFAVVEFAQARVDRYMRALHAELHAAAPPAEPVRSIYFGGGTPSALGGARIGELLATQMPGAAVTLSHLLNPTLREYRRASSACIDASSISVP